VDSQDRVFDLEDDDYPLSDLKIPVFSNADVAWGIFGFLVFCFLTIALMVGIWDIASSAWSWLRG
jgi:hypothetical protein